MDWGKKDSTTFCCFSIKVIQWPWAIEQFIEDILENKKSIFSNLDCLYGSSSLTLECSSDILLGFMFGGKILTGKTFFLKFQIYFYISKLQRKKSAGLLFSLIIITLWKYQTYDKKLKCQFTYHYNDKNYWCLWILANISCSYRYNAK